MSSVEDRVDPSGPSAAAGSPEDDAPTVITRKRLLLAMVMIVIAVVGLYFLIPKLAGLKQTWGQLKRGDPLSLGIGAVLELVSLATVSVPLTLIWPELPSVPLSKVSSLPVRLSVPPLSMVTVPPLIVVGSRVSTPPPSTVI